MPLTTGTLTSSTPLPLGVEGFKPPFTVTLNSSAPGRLIRLSCNGGVTYFTPTPNHSDTTMQIVGVTIPVTHVQITGAANDTWSIL